MLSWFKKIDSSDKISVLLLFCIVLTVQVIIALMWQERNVFSQYDVVFDTDPIRWHITFADGWGPEHIMHPLSNYLVAVPIRIIQLIGSTTGLIEDGGAFRNSLVVYVAPFFTALKAVSFYCIFRVLNFNLVQTLLATGIAILSFSSVVFGSVPSSYPLTGFGFAFVTLCTILIIKKESKISRGMLYVASIFTIGISSSNVMFVGWLKWFEYIAKDIKPVKGFTRAVLMTAPLLISIFIAFYALNHIVSELREQPVSEGEFSNLQDFLSKYVPPIEVQGEKALRFPEMITRTFIATVPTNNPDSGLFEHGDPIKVELSYIKKDVDVFSIIYGIVGLLVVGGGALIASRRDDIWKPLILSMLVTLGTFWLFFTWFGLGVFLYSQNWYVPCMFFIAAWLNTGFFHSKLGRSLVIALLVIMLVGDIYVINEVTQRFVPA